MKKRAAALYLLGFLFFGPGNYQECVQEYGQGIVDRRVALALSRACACKFNQATDCTMEQDYYDCVLDRAEGLQDYSLVMGAYTSCRKNFKEKK